MSRVELAKIRSLTFYDGEVTKSRRGEPIPQLTCKGSACKLYKPEVVRCESQPGGTGTDVDWKCQADLPEALRFGKTQVSCEGWSGPGDPFVLKGSCGLDYRLVHVPSSLRSDNPDWPRLGKSWFQDPLASVFYVLWGALLVYIVYSLITNCMRASRSNRNPGQRPPRPPNPPRGGFPGSFGDNQDPPPPYYPKDPNAPSNSNNQSWRPGFWSGAIVGGIANELINRRRRDPPPQPRSPYAGSYDWERPRSSMPSSSSRGSRLSPMDDDRGEGSSNLGVMRQSTGYGGSVSR